MTNKSYIFRLLPLILAFFLAPRAEATHIVGGQIVYRHVGGSSYEITLTLQRDCTLGQVGYDNPASIGIFSAATNLLIEDIRIPFMASDTVGNTIVSKCGFIGSEVCVQRTRYRDTIDLPFIQGGYIIAYQRCCRNGSLNNVIDPLYSGTTEWIELTEKVLMEGNSSPEFVAWPDVYICANTPLYFNHSAVDADGDSLVYRICTPYDGGSFTNPRPQPPFAPPYSPVFWLNPYSEQDMMGGVPLQIDPMTGIITANPNLIGQFLIGICVEEYRNGILLSTVRRDFQYNVRQCLEPLAAGFDVNINACDSLNFTFTNTTTDGSSYEWNFNYPSTDTTFISTEVNPVFTYPQPGAYTVRMLARSANGACDSIVYKQIVASAGSVKPELNLAGSQFTVCPGDRIPLLSVPDTLNIYQWSPPEGLDLSDPSNPYFQGTMSGIYNVTVTNPQLCTNTGTIEIIVRPNTEPLTITGSRNVCDGNADLTVSGGNSSFEWSTNALFNPVISTEERLITTFAGLSSTFYVRSVGAVCGDVTDSVTVYLQPVDISYPRQISICRGDTVSVNLLNNISGHILEYAWDDAHFINTTGSTITLTTLPGDTSGYTVSGFVNNQYGCRDTAIIHVMIVDAPEVNFTSVLRSCEDETMCFTLTGNYSGSLLWDFGTTASNDTSTVENPCFKFPFGGTYTVTLTNTNTACAFTPVTKQILVPSVGDQEVDVNYTLTECNSREVCFEVEGDYQGNVLWNFDDPDSGSNNTSSSAIPCHKFSRPGTYNVTLTNIQPTCPFAEVTVQVIIAPDFAINPIPEEVICEGESIQLTATSNDPSARYIWTNEAGTQIGTGNSVSINTLNDITVKVTATTEKGCTDTVTTTVRVFKFDYSVTWPEIICPGSEYRIMANINAPDNYDYVWTPAECIVMGGNTASPLVMAIPGKTITLKLTNKETGCSETKQMTPDVKAPLVYQFSGLLCHNQPSEVSISVQGQGPYTYEWSPEAYIVSGANTANPTVRMLPGQQLTVVVTNQVTGCIETLTYSPQVLDPLSVQFDDQVVEINQGRDAVLSVKNPLPGATYAWSNGDTGTDTTVDPIENTTYTVTVTDANGCTGTGQVTVNVRVVGCTDKDEYLPNAFSPNGDGKNDVLYVKSNVITEMTLVIYNRWGREMFSTQDINTGWDGTYNGTELAPDAYAYYLTGTCINGDQFIKKGNVSLLR